MHGHENSSANNNSCLSVNQASQSGWCINEGGEQCHSARQLERSLFLGCKPRGCSNNAWYLTETSFPTHEVKGKSQAVCGPRCFLVRTAFLGLLSLWPGNSVTESNIVSEFHQVYLAHPAISFDWAPGVCAVLSLQHTPQGIKAVGVLCTKNLSLQLLEP